MPARTSYLRARFTEPAEFIAELERDVELVERGIVRVAIGAKPAGPAGVLTRITVLAGAIVEGRPVYLERPIGELWGEPSTDTVVKDEADGMRQTLKTAIVELGLEPRLGLIEEVPGR